jgi:hypothetical protein
MQLIYKYIVFVVVGYVAAIGFLLPSTDDIGYI